MVYSRKGRKLATNQALITNYYPRVTPTQYAAGALLYHGGKAAMGQVTQKLKDWRKVGKSQSRLSKKLMGPSRKLQPVRSKAITTRNIQGEQTGGYTQWEQTKGKATLSKNLSKVTQMMRMLNSSKEKVIYRWNGVKNFDDNGFYWLQNRTVVGRRYLPCYAFDLTSCLNAQANGTQISSAPMCKLYTIAGDVGFEAVSGLQPDGATSTSTWTIEQAGYSGAAGDLSMVKPHNKDYLKWLSVKMNMWGCKNRSTRFTMQLVQFKEESCCPNDFTAVNNQRTALFQALIKSKAFNPISTSSTQLRKYYKVLKSESFIIQPTSTTETDQDPHVRTVSWFVRMNKFLDYVQQANKITTDADLLDQADFVQNIGQQNDCYIKPEKRVYLMIYATNFGVDAADSNVDTPSFDLSIRACHEVLTT